MSEKQYKNDLEKYFYNNKGRLIYKWLHYFEIYDRYFSKYRNKEVVIVEIGIFQGGSLQMWKNYFGPKVKVYGIDIDPRCKEFEEENIEIFIGSQSDPEFLEKFKKSIPKIDILLDDGGHTMNQMKTSFLHLFDHIKDDGIYMIEDTLTCYWNQYGGGHKRSGSFIEYTKNLIDDMHAWESEQSSLKVNNYTRTINSIHYYNSIIVIEKGHIVKPTNLKTGNVSFPYSDKEKRSFIVKALDRISRVLAIFRLPAIGVK